MSVAHASHRWPLLRARTSHLSDNGAGGAELGSGSGLRGLADRVEALGGSLTVRDGDRGGVCVQAELPCP